MDKRYTHSELDNLIAAYLADIAQPEAIRQLDDAAQASEDNRQYIRQQLEVWFSAGVASQHCRFDAEAAYNRFECKMAAVGTPTSAKVRWHKRWIRMAVATAAVALALLLPWAGYQYATRQWTLQMADVSITAPMGATARVNLPDGTAVWLNAGSRIDYAQSYGLTHRHVRLEGEASFDVAKNKRLPFTVESKTASLKVTGTKFTYADYPEENRLTVNLLHGSVKLTGRKSGQTVQMKPNERVTISKQTGRMDKTKVNAAQADAWTHGELFFDELPMAEIARQLERRYKAKIEVAPYLQKKTFYGMFNTHDATLEDVLSIMAETKQMNYRKANGKYQLY